MKPIICLLLILAVFRGNAQWAPAAATGRAWQQAFPPGTKLQWTHYYRGRIDGINDIAITLAWDGRKCAGKMVYLRSQEQFRLEGRLHKQRLLLAEKDGRDSTTGYLNGYLTNDSLRAEWQNRDNTLGGTLQLWRTAEEELTPSFCGNDKWIRRFRGALLHSEAELVLQNGSQGRITGSVYIKTGNRSYTLSGQPDEQGVLTLSMKDQYQQIAGILSGKYAGGDNLRLRFDNRQGQESYATFELRQTLPLDCIEYADYLSAYDITFPKSTSREFNTWMEEQTMDWLTECRYHASRLKQQYSSPPASLRFSARATGWCEVVVMNESCLSGWLTFSHSWKDQYETKSFNFDLSKGKAIRLDDLFRKEASYESVIRNIIRQEIQRHPLYSDPGFREWIDRENFSHFVLRREGISFASNYNGTYGRQTVTLTYEQLAPFLKKNAPLGRFRSSAVAGP